MRTGEVQDGRDEAAQDADGSAAQAPPPRLGWLPLPSGDVVPITGLTPAALQDSVSKVISKNGQTRPADAVLQDVIAALGIGGASSKYAEVGWPTLQRAMADHGARTWVDMLVLPWIDLNFRIERRALADRIFNGPWPISKRIFIGYGHEWEVWWTRDHSQRRIYDVEEIRSYTPQTVEDASRWVLQCSSSLSIRLLNDVLFGPAPPNSFEHNTYWPWPCGWAQRQAETEATAKVLSVFRWCIDRLPGGWVDIVRITESLALLVASDGAYDFIWREYRTGPPTDPNAQILGDLIACDLPRTLQAEHHFNDWLYFRRGGWLQRDEYDAEQLHYASGGGLGIHYPGMTVLLRRLLQTRGEYVPLVAKVHIPATVDGFERVQMPNGQTLLVSQPVTVGELDGFLHDSGFGARRTGERLAPANGHGANHLPAAATFQDVYAYRAWMERRLNLPLRLLTFDEHRALRPFADGHDGWSGVGDFPWENRPPRAPLPSAVDWQTPRFRCETRSEAAKRGHRVLTLSDEPSDEVWSKVWLETDQFPPGAPWIDPLPVAVYQGLRFIDAWDALEWCEDGRAVGRFWAGGLGGLRSWGAYKHCKIGFRLVVDGAPQPIAAIQVER